jgi:hypothetical protein
MAAASAAVVSLPASAYGSSSTPVGLTMAVEENAADNESSSDSFRWYRDEDGVDCKANGSVADNVPSHNLHNSLNPLGPSCSWVSLELAAPVASHTGSFTVVYHWTQLLYQTPLSSLLVLCQCCSKLSLLRSLAWLFVWL